MNGTIQKRNNDDSIHLIGINDGWLLEDTATGEIFDETKDYAVRDEWIKKYKLNRNVDQFWYKENENMKIMNERKTVLSSSRKAIKSSKKVIKSKLNFDKIADTCDDLDFSTLGYNRDPYGNMIAELDAIEGESGNIEGVEIRFTENDDGQTVIAVYKKDHKVDTMTAKLVDGEISRDDINEAIYDFLEENSQMLNSSRKAIKSGYVIFYSDGSSAWGRISRGKPIDDFISADGEGLVINPNVGAMTFGSPKEAEEWLNQHEKEWNPGWGEILEVDENGNLYDLEGDILTSARKPVKSALESEAKEEVSVDVNSLYHFLGGDGHETESDFAVVRFEEDDGEEYYDIVSDEGNLACMDGETCEVLGKTEDFVELHSVEAEDGVNFKLSPEEFEVACGKSKKEIKSSLTSDSFEMIIGECRKMAKDLDSKLGNWWVKGEVGQDVVYFVAEHNDYSVRVRFEFMDSGFCYVSKVYTNGSYYEPVVLESWKYEGLSAQEIESKILNVLENFFPKYNEIESSKKAVKSAAEKDYSQAVKLCEDLQAYPGDKLPPAGIYKRLLEWKSDSEKMEIDDVRDKYGTFTAAEWIKELKESV